MEFEPGFRFDMENDSFGMCSQAMSCPSTASFSSSSSVYDPFTPSSRRSTPNNLSLEFDSNCGSFSTHHAQLTPPSASSMSKYLFGHVKTEHEHIPFPETLPTTPMKKMEAAPMDFEHMMEMNMQQQQHMAMGSMTPSHSFDMYTITPEAAMGPFMMTPTQSLAGSDMTNTTPWLCPNDSPTTSFFPQMRSLQPHELDISGLDRHANQSPLGHYATHEMHGSGGPSPNRLRAQKKMMVREIQRKTSELQHAQIQAVSRKQRVGKPGAAPVDRSFVRDFVPRAMCKCDYEGCTKAFRRNEHLKRHKQTYHSEGPNKFSCEFCHKAGFNRQDNLNNHRKLHARPNSRNRGVEYMPAAAAVIEQEERSRKRRAPPKFKMSMKRGATGGVDMDGEF